MCYGEDIIQAYIDKELPENEMNSVSEHIASCPVCQRIYQELLDDNNYISSLLDAYQDQIACMPLPAPVFPAAAPGGEHKSSISGLPEETGYIKKGLNLMHNKTLRRITYSAAAVAVLLLVTIGPLKSAAADLLGIFRVESFTALEFTPQDMKEIENAFSNGGKVDLKELGKITTDGTPETREASMEDAKDYVDFPVKQITSNKVIAGSAQITDRCSATVVFDSSKINSLIESLGGESSFPDDIDGKELSMEFPASVRTVYSPVGDTDQTAAIRPSSDIEEGSYEVVTPENSNNTVTLLQSPSPQLTVPEGVDVQKLKDAMLDLPFWPQNIRQQLEGINDWSHTLPIPVNIAEEKTKEVDINGAEGLLLHRSGQNGESEYNMVVWHKQGIVYSLSGNITSREALLYARSVN